MALLFSIDCLVVHLSPLHHVSALHVRIWSAIVLLESRSRLPITTAIVMYRTYLKSQEISLDWSLLLIAICIRIKITWTTRKDVPRMEGESTKYHKFPAPT
ncbi:hypothetical protein K469DRAFT_709484 [Zopfia rhizophila CBS 207.26]|uniref:Uncharacterized protein n=1 Tax=Zopfia rhizophila CBS 207.26 TaxID=1314779 RepID=A0A6A6EVU7_9PEZI|nr:hypothetical protein K469DRAFT_709484 [Zopfia rhizophila CBS 207.26]